MLRQIMDRGADQVIGLVIVALVRRPAESGNQFAQHRHLLPQRFGHRRPVGLVVGGQSQPECRFAAIEKHGAGNRTIVFFQLEQQPPESEERVGRKAVLAAQMSNRIKRPEYLGIGVDQNRRGAGSHRCNFPFCFRFSRSGVFRSSRPCGAAENKVVQGPALRLLRGVMIEEEKIAYGRRTTEP
ncbi:hypothetical protein SDC9_94962 [bioreactor metagenome]|uniref:Uncharacterized protein n=1 Tax=bioreactor metagenome TaxID=1076179 RepID=A0A645A696_9ZZZZ